MSADPALERLLDAATAHHRAGCLSEARRLYAQVLAAQPENPVALFRLGLVDLQEGRLEAALAGIDQAAALAPREARYAFGQGQVLDSLRRWPQAAAAYGRVLALEPDSVDAHVALGVALQRAGELEGAAAAYRAALARRPDAASALGNLGAVLREMGELGSAIRTLERAAQLEPCNASHLVNLGIALSERRDFAAAAQRLEAALGLEPGNADAAFNLGNSLRGLGRTHEACEAFRRAVALRPGHVEALNNLGNACKELGDFPAALAAFEVALERRPDYVVAINNAGCLLRSLGRIDAAEDLLRRGLKIEPDHPALLDNLGNVLKDGGALHEAIDCYRRSLAIEPGNPATHGNLAYALSFESAEPGPVLDECRRWNARFAAPLTRSAAAARDLSPARRLKVGYVSGDFREHCQTLFTLPLFEHHDRNAVAIYGYSSVERPDERTQRLARTAAVWREVRRLEDEELARLIAADGIDILVDLNMHMANGRPLVFARKPAPVQIAWLAYPGTTGMDAIDYRFSDPRLDPPGVDAHYQERTLRLEDTFWCYDPLTDDIPVHALPAAARGYVTFGCLNNPCKLTDRTLELWAGVLRALPDARLKILATAGRHRARLLERLETQGVASSRVIPVDFQPREAYLREYHGIDVGLDTFPYNGHTTSLDALWMGIPIVSRIGATCVGRGGLSQLHHLDLRHLAAASDDGFVTAAIELARDLPGLARLRTELRPRMQRSALMDAERFARAIERAYRCAWQAHVAASY